MKRNIIVQVYDPNIKEAPFKFVKIDEFTVNIERVVYDHYGERFVRDIVLSLLKRNKKYSFRFYNTDENEENIFVVVHNENSPGSKGYPYKHY